ERGELGGCGVAPPPELEEELRDELDHARVAHRARDDPEGLERVDVAPRGSEVRVIEQVERLGPDLQVPRAARLEALRKRGVDVVVAGRRGDAGPAGSERAERRDLERGDVEPLAVVGSVR